MGESAVRQPRHSEDLQALADQCVQCGLCLPHCPTYRLDAAETESPRGRIAYMKAVAAGTLAPTAAGDRHLDHCLGCRRCESVCPAGVEYGALLVGARSRQFERAPPQGRARLALWLLGSGRPLDALLRAYRLLFPWLPAGWRRLPRPPRSVPVAVEASAPTALFVGCVAGVYEAGARQALLRLLAAAGVPASIPSDQGCCGAAAGHAGNAAAAQALSEQNRAAFHGRERVLCLASGCQETLAASLAGIAPAEDAVSFLERHAERLQFRSAGGRRVALHLPCTQRSVTGTGPALRRLLDRVPDLALVELPDTGCCGAAGLHMLLEPDRASALRAPLLAALTDSRATELLSANIGCRLHLANGHPLPMRHPIEFLAEQLA